MAGCGALPGRTHLAGFQEAHDLGGRSRRRRAEGPPRGSGGQVLEHHRRCRRAALTGRKMDRVAERSRRLGSRLCDAGDRRPCRADHEREVRGPGAAMVARQHTHCVRCERTGSLRRPAPLRGDDRIGSGEGDDRRRHQRPRHRHRAAVVARRHAAGVPAHRPAQFRRYLGGRREAARPRPHGCPTRCRRESIARSSSSRKA